MKLQTILVQNKLDPVEVSMWLEAHPDLFIVEVTVSDSVFYIFYSEA